MIRITYCPRCRSGDENCPACGEPVRSLRAAQFILPACDICGQATVPYYKPPGSYDARGLGTFWVACPVYAEGRAELFAAHNPSDHANDIVTVPNEAIRRRIDIKLHAERDGVLDPG